MRPGCGAPLLIGIIVATTLPGRARGQEKKPEARHLPPEAYAVAAPIPVISCDVSTTDVSAGQSVEVTTRVVQGDAELKYSFKTSAGKLTIASANAHTALLDTTGIASGEISITCVVVDAYGRKVSYSKMIRIRGV